MEYLCTLEEGQEKAIKIAKEKFKCKGTLFPFMIEEVKEIKIRDNIFPESIVKKESLGLFCAFNDNHEKISSIDINVENSHSYDDHGVGYYGDFFPYPSSTQEADNTQTPIGKDGEYKISMDADMGRWLLNLELDVFFTKRDKRISKFIEELDEELGIKYSKKIINKTKDNATIPTHFIESEEYIKYDSEDKKRSLRKIAELNKKNIYEKKKNKRYENELKLLILIRKYYTELAYNIMRDENVPVKWFPEIRDSDGKLTEDYLAVSCEEFRYMDIDDFKEIASLGEKYKIIDYLKKIMKNKNH